ncbi:small integral membrane protein 26-like [Boleophthalmus pectinirostris]|uniref:small integral membrane protein 26-like n=1 Tax=Boleophthalmus pectinirostris TaxID=150288 RepID=UPI00242DE7D0|nr:small integral membrane protein 26-like [Boleophthalmus pectinirostris]
MEPKKVMQWNTRASAVYALGVWTMVGSYLYFKYTGKFDTPEFTQPPKTEEMENPNEVTYNTAHSKTVIVYKKDFVPYTTRIMNFIESFTGGAPPGDRDNGK